MVGFGGAEWMAEIAISWRESMDIVCFEEDGAVWVLWVVTVCVAQIGVNGAGSGRWSESTV